jgi:D-apiose dehydrogenase
MADLRFAIFGTGFWSRFQLAAWREIPGAHCVALYNRTPAKAEKLAHEFGISAVYDDPEELLRREQIDFVDIITAVETHSELVHLAAARGLPVICQKPMAPSLEIAEDMVAACSAARVPFFVHENWRWQTPIRALKQALVERPLGRIFRARIEYCNDFPVFDNQPFLKEVDHFILADIGSHILDVARFLFGEAQSLYCQTQRVHRDINGEDVATVIMQMGPGTSVICEMSYATRTAERRFPETLVFVEGEYGSVELAGGHWIHIVDQSGTLSARHVPPHLPWAEPAYDLVHSSIVPCNRDLFNALSGQGAAETTGEDNLRTARLVFGAYRSAGENQVVVP